MKRPQFIHKNPYSFVLADGVAPFQVLGTIELSIQFVNMTTTIQAHIARNLCADMILGMDYINKYNLNIDVKQQTIAIEYNNRILTMNIDQDFELHKIPVTSSKAIYIPPHSNRSSKFPNTSENSSHVAYPSSNDSILYHPLQPERNPHPKDPSFLSRHSLLPFPNTSEHSSHIAYPSNNDLINHHPQQPQLNSHVRFLNRSIETCPKHLTGKKRTKWLKAGEKAQKNNQILNNHDAFYWPESHYGHPIHIHHQTPLHIIQSLIQEISDVHLFTIDTESDKPTIRQPKPVPALIQIQAIHNETLSTVILIEKAIQYTFDKALDKSSTLNIWSCGLDSSLQTSNTSEDKCARESLITYAINDLFAVTQLYFHFSKSNIQSQTSTSLPHLNTIMPSETINVPSFLILSDSHGKHLKSMENTSKYTMITHSISGLQWINQYDSKLCARSIILSSSMTSILSKSAGVLCLIGTNSVRTTHALQIIQQIEDIIHTIRLHHAHLTHKHGITIVQTFPCFKVSKRFPSTTLLSNNIDTYNKELQLISKRMNFSCVNFHITNEHLHHDHMHLKYQYQNVLSHAITNYFDAVIKKKLTLSQNQRRSRTSVTNRNKRIHEKLRAKQKQNILIRPISILWKLPDIKQVLKHYNIQYARLPEIYKHKLRIQFNNELYLQQAERILSSNIFDEQNFLEWHRQHQ
ncbi:unnamed protein product [Rotaria sp. Silwood1]|nr:unnamed protein product [Rotaria sp. Silwood1]CAF0887175.1 unnamed protein product [Rotaria sp. Silwood1]CAF0901077.1 unnamed protein product [Rotaria sp. Silwood1]CAF3372921.1 unnamed protein product [Rotaria sp. Silwood1]CAF3377516.1 unnamed protein product [Rotaria sp. Silwood1]